ncbi:LAMI_0D06546g1_1 [Lachancea mirantina]|uniref:LAMI_0D06546g1_1 n=1 Tax=Lachancea mirantina TaxID=1230905 RepID=A0A1G4JC42_9SACH|nr:LAMI_0D06546g1_1 [Lachancea mirantina]
MSDSDSDFGDFAASAAPAVSAASAESAPKFDLDSCLDTVFGKESDVADPTAAQDACETPGLSALLQGRRRVIYEQLVLLDVALHPVSWRSSKLRSTLLHTLQIEEPVPAPAVRRTALNSTLFDQIIAMLDSTGSTPDRATPDRDFVSNLLRFGSEDSQSDSTALEDLLRSIPDQLPSDQLLKLHDQLVFAILHCVNDIRTDLAQQRELENDIRTYEAVVTNLMGHTQRVRRHEIARYNAKHKRTSRYGFNFKWVR